MKKVILLLAVGSFMFGMTSCKKDYTCDCVDSNGTSVGSTTYKAKKSDAESSCDALNTTWSAGGGSCSLK